VAIAWLKESLTSPVVNHVCWGNKGWLLALFFKSLLFSNLLVSEELPMALESSILAIPVSVYKSTDILKIL
jgi:hypothetical protein